MNWIGGSRSRIRQTSDQKKLREHFKKKRLESHYGHSRLESASTPASSRDLITFNFLRLKSIQRSAPAKRTKIVKHQLECADKLKTKHVDIPEAPLEGGRFPSSLARHLNGSRKGKGARRLKLSNGFQASEDQSVIREEEQRENGNGQLNEKKRSREEEASFSTVKSVTSFRPNGTDTGKSHSRKENKHGIEKLSQMFNFYGSPVNVRPGANGLSAHSNAYGCSAKKLLTIEEGSDEINFDFKPNCDGGFSGKTDLFDEYCKNGSLDEGRKHFLTSSDFVNSPVNSMSSTPDSPASCVLHQSAVFEGLTIERGDDSLNIFKNVNTKRSILKAKRNNRPSVCSTREKSYTCDIKIPNIGQELLFPFGGGGGIGFCSAKSKEQELEDYSLFQEQISLLERASSSKQKKRKSRRMDEMSPEPPDPSYNTVPVEVPFPDSGSRRNGSFSGFPIPKRVRMKSGNKRVDASGDNGGEEERSFERPADGLFESETRHYIRHSELRKGGDGPRRNPSINSMLRSLRRCRISQETKNMIRDFGNSANGEGKSSFSGFRDAANNGTTIEQLWSGNARNEPVSYEGVLNSGAVEFRPQISKNCFLQPENGECTNQSSHIKTLHNDNGVDERKSSCNGFNDPTNNGTASDELQNCNAQVESVLNRELATNKGAWSLDYYPDGTEKRPETFKHSLCPSNKERSNQSSSCKTVSDGYGDKLETEIYGSEFNQGHPKISDGLFSFTSPSSLCIPKWNAKHEINLNAKEAVEARTEEAFQSKNRAKSGGDWPKHACSNVFMKTDYRCMFPDKDDLKLNAIKVSKKAEFSLSKGAAAVTCRDSSATEENVSVNPKCSTPQIGVSTIFGEFYSTGRNSKAGEFPSPAYEPPTEKQRRLDPEDNRSSHLRKQPHPQKARNGVDYVVISEEQNGLKSEGPQSKGLRSCLRTIPEQKRSVQDGTSEPLLRRPKFMPPLKKPQPSFNELHECSSFDRQFRTCVSVKCSLRNNDDDPKSSPIISSNKVNMVHEFIQNSEAEGEENEIVKDAISEMNTADEKHLAETKRSSPGLHRKVENSKNEENENPNASTDANKSEKLAVRETEEQPKDSCGQVSTNSVDIMRESKTLPRDKLTIEMASGNEDSLNYFRAESNVSDTEQSCGNGSVSNEVLQDGSPNHLQEEDACREECVGAQLESIVQSEIGDSSLKVKESVVNEDCMTHGLERKDELEMSSIHKSLWPSDGKTTNAATQTFVGRRDFACQVAF